MWITEQLGQKEGQAVATTADVTMTDKNKVSTSGSENLKGVPVFSPFGVQSIPPAGTTVLLVNADKGAVCCGSINNKGNLEAGEVKIYSSGGASIVLKNNGDILLNGAKITRDGKFTEAGD